MWWTLELTLHAFTTKIRNAISLCLFSRPHPCLTTQFASYSLFITFTLLLRFFSFLISCHRSTLLGLRYRWDTAISVTGQGHYCCCTSSRLCLFYDSSVMPHFPLPLRISPSPRTCTSTNRLLSPSTCHRHRAVCLYPCMCIPYSISRCSLTLYGALAGHRRLCQSSFIRFCCLAI
jgi:hypothetical protein